MFDAIFRECQNSLAESTVNSDFDLESLLDGINNIDKKFYSYTSLLPPETEVKILTTVLTARIF